MSLKVGSRLRTPTSACEVIVVRGPSGEGDLVCAGEVMTAEAVTPQEQASGDPVLLGKRYVDEESGVEVLCTKPGSGPLAYDGRALTVKSAAQLPASD